jgi:hypothetical protein
MGQSRWKEWANEWGLVHSPMKMFNYSSEWIAGMRDQRLVRVGWAGDKGQRLMVLIRFPRVGSAEALRETLRTNESLIDLPGWKKLKSQAPKKVETPVSLPKTGAELGREKIAWNLSPQDLVVDETSVIWSHAFAWSRPKPDKVRRWVEALLAAVSRATSGFDDRCEECRSAHVNGFVLYEGVPMLLCEGCRARSATAGEMAQQQYEQLDANYLLGILYATIAAAVGGTLWALFAIWSGKLYLAAAIGIGFLVAFCYKLGAQKLDRIGQIMGALLTIASVVLGDIIYYAWQVKLVRPDIGFRLDAGWYALQEMVKESPGDIILTLVFAAVGAFVAAGWLQKPRFAPKIQTAEEAATSNKKIA